MVERKFFPGNVEDCEGVLNLALRKPPSGNCQAFDKRAYESEARALTD